MDELFIDLEKGRINTAKLTRKLVTVRGKGGRTFKRWQWVKPWEASTGHGVRAIHNIFDLDIAKEDGVHFHGHTQEALKHQGIHNAHHLYEGMHHEHPIFIPETPRSAERVRKRGERNHIPHGATEYNRHEHTNQIHHSDEEDEATRRSGLSEEEYNSVMSDDYSDLDRKAKDNSDLEAEVELPSGSMDYTADMWWDYAQEEEYNQEQREQLVHQLGSRYSNRHGMITNEDDVSFMLKVADVLGVDPDWVMSRVDERRIGRQPSETTEEPEPMSMPSGDMHTEDEKKIRAMTSQRTPGSYRSSGSVKEITKPLDFSEIKRNHPGPTVADLFSDKDTYGYLHAQHEGIIQNYGEDAPTPLKLSWADAMDIFGDMPVPAIEHIFSHPDGAYVAKLETLTPIASPRSKTTFKMNVGLYDKNNVKIGTCDRTIRRQPNGTLSVHNDILSLYGEDGQREVGKHLYHRTDQMWTHMANGNKVEFEVYANISIGKYAWAAKDKGFDFAGTWERDSKRAELREFIKLNGWDEEEVMQACGYTNVDDLSHAWQFAELDDGYVYDMTPHGLDAGAMSRKQLKGKANLGKAFMLTSGSSWNGIKVIEPSGEVKGNSKLDENRQFNWDTDEWEDMVADVEDAISGGHSLDALSDDDLDYADDDFSNLFDELGESKDVKFDKSMTAEPEVRQFKASKYTKIEGHGSEGLTYDPKTGGHIADDSWLHPSVGLRPAKPKKR